MKPIAEVLPADEDLTLPFDAVFHKIPNVSLAVIFDLSRPDGVPNVMKAFDAFFGRFLGDDVNQDAAGFFGFVFGIGTIRFVGVFCRHGS